MECATRLNGCVTSCAGWSGSCKTPMPDSRGGTRVKNWVREVREVAYHAEDVVDTFTLKIGRKHGAITDVLRRYACIPSNLVALHEIGVEIGKIKSKLRSIKANRDAFGIVNLGENGEDPAEETVHKRMVHSHLDDDVVFVGVDNNKAVLLERVMNSTVERRCVFSVVGMGSLGKTTLVVWVYNCNEVKSHFTFRVWITVPQRYKAKDLIKNIIMKCPIGMSKEALETMEGGDLASALYDFLQERKYLIVLDDVWAEKVWEEIKTSFPNAMDGSRVLMTTHFGNVARFADP